MVNKVKAKKQIKMIVFNELSLSLSAMCTSIDIEIDQLSIIYSNRISKNRSVLYGATHRRREDLRPTTGRED